jgi:hypothetical protein
MTTFGKSHGQLQEEGKLKVVVVLSADMDDACYAWRLFQTSKRNR